MKPFKFNYTVNISDINYGGHMGNDRSLSLFQEARLAFLNSIDYSEKNIGEGKGIIMKNAQIEFLAEIFHRDQLEVKVCLGEVKGLLFHFEYDVVRKADEKLVLKGKTAILAFNYEKKKVARIPTGFLEKIKQKYGTEN